MQNYKDQEANTHPLTTVYICVHQRLNKLLIFLMCLLTGCTLLPGKERKVPDIGKQVVVVVKLAPDGPAQRMGIKVGDIILKYDGKTIHSSQELQELRKNVHGKKVKVVVLRGEKKLSFMLPEGRLGVYVSEKLPDIEFKKDAVILEGIDRLEWILEMSNSYMLALARTINYLGINKDYTQLMGISSAAFRLHFHKDWCPSSPDPTVGFNCGKLVLKRLGFVESEFLLKDGIAEEKVRQRIIESIDNGVPVIAIDLKVLPEWGIITGYQSQGQEFVCRTYFDKTWGYDIAKKFPWQVVILKQETITLPDTETFIQSLQLAQELSETEMYGDYYSGVKALEYWIEKLKTEQFDTLSDEKLFHISHTNAWIYNRLGEDRWYAAQYLKRIALVLEELSPKVSELAQIYAQESSIIRNASDVVLYRSQIKSRKDWTPETREKEVNILRQMLEFEKQALTILKEINKG